MWSAGLLSGIIMTARSPCRIGVRRSFPSVVRPCSTVLGLVFFFVAVRVSAWTNEIYVWQRAERSAVESALTVAAEQCDGFNLLGSEISNASSVQPNVVRPKLDLMRLAQLGRPVGLSLRVGPYAGGFGETENATKCVLAEAELLVRQARDAGLRIAELQLDYDCAESRISGYAEWLRLLRVRLGPEVRLVFTALPSWLKHRAQFAALCAAADGFVLQVHSLEKPTSRERIAPLCDSARALVWAETANAFGKPFRVALPTYGYVLGFAPQGRFIGLSAEGPQPLWPDGTQTVIVAAEPEVMQRLAQELKARALKNCTGLIWFRLPLPGDRLNWPWPTLSAVLRGETLEAELVGEARVASGATVDVVLHNRGNRSARVLAVFQLGWKGEAVVVAADGLGGFEPLRPGDVNNKMEWRWREKRVREIMPGETVKVGWVRFSNENFSELSCTNHD